MQPAGTLAGRTANSIHWSPQGRNLVLAGLKVGICCAEPVASPRDCLRHATTRHDIM